MAVYRPQMLLILITIGVMLEKSANSRLVAGCLIAAVAAGISVAVALVVPRFRRDPEKPRD
jgi:NADH:ubiquinone oxidoreductase subunit K